MNRYLEYNLDDLLEDRAFVCWALYGENENGWEKLLSENPGFSVKAEKAKEIILLLKDSPDVISVEEKRRMWNNIEGYHNLLQRQDKVRTLRKALSYAAIIFILVAVGAASYWYYTGQKGKFEFASINAIPGNGASKLILSNGEVFDLKKDNSSVVIKGNESIIINDERSIDLHRLNKPAGKDVLMSEVVIPYGNKSLLTLDDGTKVWLNAGSRLAFPTVFTGTKREVYLEGDAYFDVAYAAGRPFTVSAGEISLKVLGTRFYVSSYSSEEEIVTVLMEGSVAIRKNSAFRLPGNERILEPGQKATYTKNEKQVNISEESDPGFYIAWTEGWFQFEKESLYTVFRKLERYYNVDIIYDETFDDMIGGKLDLKDSISKVMKTLSTLSDITFRIDNEKVYVDKKAKKN